MPAKYTSTRQLVSWLVAQCVRPPNYHEIFRQNIEQRQQLNRLKLFEWVSSPTSRLTDGDFSWPHEVSHESASQHRQSLIVKFGRWNPSHRVDQNLRNRGKWNQGENRRKSQSLFCEWDLSNPSIQPLIHPYIHHRRLLTCHLGNSASSLRISFFCLRSDTESSCSRASSAGSFRQLWMIRYNSSRSLKT